MRTGKTMKSNKNIKQILHAFMNVNLEYTGSYCDRRIIAMGFVDCSWTNNGSGSVMKTIKGVEYEVFCPNATTDQPILSHEDFTWYGISLYDGKDITWVDGTFTAEEVIAYIKKIEAA